MNVMRIFVFVGIILMMHHAYADESVVTDDELAEISHEINDAPVTIPDAAPSYLESLVSIDTDNPLDMNWTAALTLSGVDEMTVARPVEIPFLHKYPIHNLSIKLRVLDVQF